MKNELLDKGIITPSGEISKDKINLVAGAVTQPFAEMVWVTTGGDMETMLHQDGENAAHYVDSLGFRDVPEFLQPPTQQKELAPDDLTTGETVKTPRGSFHLTAMSREQMEAAGYGLHHQSDDGKYLIMGNGTRAFAISAEQPENHLKHIEDKLFPRSSACERVKPNSISAVS